MKNKLEKMDDRHLRRLHNVRASDTSAGRIWIWGSQNWWTIACKTRGKTGSDLEETLLTNGMVSSVSAAPLSGGGGGVEDSDPAK
jgi:hypothetical protein